MTTADLILRGHPVLRQFDTGLSGCRTAAVLPDARLALLANQSTLAVVDLDCGAVEQFPLTDEWGVKTIAGLTGRRMLLVNIGKILLYEFGNGNLTMLASWPIETSGSVLGVAAAARDPRFAVAAGDCLYIGQVGQHGLDVVHSAGCQAVCVSADGDKVAASRGGTVDIYTGQPVARWREIPVNDKGTPILSMGVSPDGRYIVAGDDSAQTVLLNTGDGVPVPIDSAGKAMATAWSDDSSAFAVVALTRLVSVQTPSGQLLAHLAPAEPGTYYFVGGGWTSQQAELAVGTEHGQILIWSFE